MDKYNKVFDLVKTGITIEKACKLANVSRGYFYKNITDAQREDLMYMKASTLKYGAPGSKMTKELMEFATLDIYDDEEIF
jgi:hypothetical protein